MRFRSSGLRNIAVAVMVVLVVDQLLYRDPGISLSHGYEIYAISSGSPCELHYSVSDDDRKYSDWTPMEWTERKDAPEGTASESCPDRHFALINSKGEILHCNSEMEWRAAIVEKRADPARIAPSLSGITGYKANQDHVIGTFRDGYFLLDMATHKLDTWASEADWKRAVSTRTSLTTTGLQDPKSWLYRTRDMPVVLGYAAIIGVTLLLTLFRHRHRASKPVG